MKRIVMCIALLASTISWGQVVTNELVFYLDANVDTDGWDFTQPAVPGGGGTLGVVVANAIPTNLMENEGGRYFHTTGVNECFAGAVPTTGVRSFTYEIWLRVNGLQFIDEDNAVAAFRKSETFEENFCSISMKAGDPRDIDFDFRDHIAGNNSRRHALHDRAELGFGSWHQVVWTYEDASDALTPDGVLSTYLDGNPTPVNVASSLVPYYTGQGVTPDQSEIRWASAFVVNNFGEAGRNLNGDIAIIRLYNAVLTTAEIARNFDAHKHLYPFPSPDPLISSNIVNVVEMQFATTNGVVYELERTTGLSGNWATTDTFVRGNGSTMRIYDSTGSSNPGFNRVRVSVP